MNQLATYTQLLLQDNVQITFEENYLRMLFDKHRELPKSDIVEFLHKAQLTGANPCLNQIFLIERNVKVGYEWKKTGTVVFSYNFLQAYARKFPGYGGYKFRTFIADKFDIHTFEAKKMLACEHIVTRDGIEFPYTAYFDEYVQTKLNPETKKMEATSAWANKPYMMIEKCSLAGALRRAYPEILAGMYVEEEMDSVINELDKEEENKAIEAEATLRVEKYEAIVEKAKPENITAHKVLIEGVKILLGELTAGETKEQKAKALTDVCGVGTFSALELKTDDELKALTEKITAIIEEKKSRELRKVLDKPSFTLKEMST